MHSDFSGSAPSMDYYSQYQATPLLEGANSHTRDTGNDAEGISRGAPQSQARTETLKPLAPKRLQCADPAQPPGPSKPPSKAKTPAAGKGGRVSKLGLKKARLGDTLGTDNRARAETRWENGIMYGMVEKEWSMLVRLESARTTETNS